MTHFSFCYCSFSNQFVESIEDLFFQILILVELMSELLIDSCWKTCFQFLLFLALVDKIFLAKRDLEYSVSLALISSEPFLYFLFKFIVASLFFFGYLNKLMLKIQKMKNSSIFCLFYSQLNFLDFQKIYELKIDCIFTY